MKPLIPLAVTLSLALPGVFPTRAQSTAKHLEPNAPRTIVVSDSSLPPVVRTALLQSTLIELPPEEKVASVFAGDTVDWVFDGGHIASRFVSIKPKVADSTTDVHIVSDHGNEYTLELKEVTSDTDSHFDSKVFIAPGDKTAKDKLDSVTRLCAGIGTRSGKGAGPCSPDSRGRHTERPKQRR